MDRLARTPAGLWPLAVAPAIWASHFLLSYVTVALVCAGRAGAPLVTLRLLLAAYTLLALAALAYYGLRCARPDGAPSARFLDQVGQWLAVLSTVAVVYAGLPALFFTGCR